MTIKKNKRFFLDYSQKLQIRVGIFVDQLFPIREWHSWRERWKKECLRPSVKHAGGSALVSAFLPVVLAFVSEKYRQALIHYAIASGKHLFGNGFIFQHANDPKHSADAVK